MDNNDYKGLFDIQPCNECGKDAEAYSIDVREPTKHLCMSCYNNLPEERWKSPFEIKQGKIMNDELVMCDWCRKEKAQFAHGKLQECLCEECHKLYNEGIEIEGRMNEMKKEFNERLRARRK